MNGILVIDKPPGITSRVALDRVKRWFPRKARLGHAGTLDPLATGVLVVCIGDATRLVNYIQAMRKSYTTRIRFGARSDTDDADGTIELTENVISPTTDEVTSSLQTFVGEIDQVPPAYSALKVGGKRVHKLTRRGNAPILDARPVRINAIRMQHYEYPFLDVEIDCGKGTYIRSIARDLGEQLGCGGLVETLRRTRIGPFTVEQGVDIEADRLDALPHLQPMSLAVSELPRVEISREVAQRVRCGQDVPITGLQIGTLVALFEKDKLVGVVTAIDNGYVHGETIYRYGPH